MLLCPALAGIHNDSARALKQVMLKLHNKRMDQDGMLIHTGMLPDTVPMTEAGRYNNITPETGDSFHY